MSEGTAIASWVCGVCGVVNTNPGHTCKCEPHSGKWVSVDRNYYRDVYMPLEGIMNEEEHILIKDDDSHWYIIPEDMEDEWWDWIESNDWDTPEWAVSLGGSPSDVVFKNYRLK